jgi:hypothetical protein
MTEIKTGAHLHFEARKIAKEITPFDPLPLFNPALIKDACLVYKNKHLEDPQEHQLFQCKRNACSECTYEVFKELKKPAKKVYSINSALYL